MMSLVGDIAAPPTIGFSAKATVAKRPRLPAARIAARRFFMMIPDLPAVPSWNSAVEPEIRPTDCWSFKIRALARRLINRPDSVDPAVVSSSVARSAQINCGSITEIEFRRAGAGLVLIDLHVAYPNDLI